MLKNKTKKQTTEKEGINPSCGCAADDPTTSSGEQTSANMSDSTEKEVVNSAEMADFTPAADDKTVADEATAKEEKLTAEVAEWKDKYMRLSAEFDNYRKRTLKEKMELVATGGEDVIKAILPVLDDIDRALAAMTDAKDVEAVRTGVELISQKLNDTLRSKGLSEIESVGLELDTDFHEAVAKFPVEEERKGKIIDVVQKGYKLKDKVVRYAKVVVGE